MLIVTQESDNNDDDNDDDANSDEDGNPNGIWADTTSTFTKKGLDYTISSYEYLVYISLVCNPITL